MQLPFTDKAPVQDRRWEFALPEPVEQEEWVAVFHIYADASGKLPKDDFTSFCGYVAHVSEWSVITQEWDNCRFRWQVPPIHMSAVMYPDRDQEWLKIKTQWGSDWDAKRDAMLLDFAATIRTARIVFVGATVDAIHFRKLAAEDSVFKDVYRDTLYLGFHTVVMRGIDATEIVDNHSPISLVIDDDQEYSINCYRIIESLKGSFPRVKQRIHGVAFVNDKSFPGVQAADMVAYEARNLMIRKMTDPNAQPSELYRSLAGFHELRMYTPSLLDKLRADMHAEIAQRQKEAKP